MKRKQSYFLQNLMIALLLSLSIGSYIYVNSVELESKQIPKVNTIYAEDLEESEEILPDLHLIKKVMHKAIEFVTSAVPAI